jgi:serine protease inhibitor
MNDTVQTDEFSKRFLTTVLHSDNISNVVISPFSVFLAILMTLSGARGSTREEINTALSLSSKDDIKLHESIHALYEAFQPALNEKIINIASNVFTDKKIQLKQEYVDVINKYYNTKLEQCDFHSDPSGSCQKINHWVEETTNHLIKNLIPQGSITPDTKMILANAIYFKGKWKAPFEMKNTKKLPFRTPKGNNDVDMMIKYEKKHLYGENETAKWVKLDYEGDFEATFVIPTDTNDLSLDNVQQLLAKQIDLPTSCKKLKRLMIPRFEISFNTELNVAMRNLGMNAAFTDSADFSGITDTTNLAISTIIHKAFIKVDEVGTEAAAATGVVMMALAMRIEKEYEFVCDRPFLYMIHHVPTKTLIFSGRVLSL